MQVDGCVAGAFFGKSEKGWITTELFYGWLANHFVAHIPPSRPVVLLVDGHSTHIDIEISKFCQQNDIFLYCLPAHSSHITQPLDVGFYGPLKQSWRKAVTDYATENFGKSVTKQTFAGVFKQAWEKTVKVSTIVNSFRSAGIYPVDFTALRGAKLAPAALYKAEVPSKQSSSDLSTCPECKPNEAALEALEKAMDRETQEKFTTRYEEGYDLETDELYVVWAKLKALSIEDEEDGSKQKSAEPQQGSVTKGRRKAVVEQGRESSEERERLEQEKRIADKGKGSRKSMRKGRKKGVAKLGEFGERQDEQQRERVGEKKKDGGESQVKNGSEKEERHLQQDQQRERI